MKIYQVDYDPHFIAKLIRIENPCSLEQLLSICLL